jgi:hypothetical protein
MAFRLFHFFFLLIGQELLAKGGLHSCLTHTDLTSFSIAFSSLSNAPSMDDKKAANALVNGGVMGAMVTCLGTTKNDSF